MAHTHAATHNSMDELDPHGFEQGHGQHKSHVIVGPFTLRSVLAALLFLTVLTVFQARLEVYLAHALEIEFPRWVNVVFCMAIAVIKALLVMGYFMQLKYDNPINTIVMAFTILGLGLFLGFTSLDLLNRDSVYAWKAGQVIPGGKSNGVTTAGGKPLVEAARVRWMEKWGPEQFQKYEADYHHAHAATHNVAPSHAEHAASNANRSRARTGVTGALSTEAPASQHTPAPHSAPAPHDAQQPAKPAH